MKRIILIIALCLVSVILSAKITLAPVIGDNMVLQQSSDVALWGSAKPDSKVEITVSWAKGKTVVHSDADGRWIARVFTPSAGGPYEMTFSDGEELTVRNVLIGEVWICMGQSNMEMRMRGLSGQPVAGAVDLIFSARPSTLIRSCNIKRQVSLKPEEVCEAIWSENTPSGVADASAVAYFFAKYLYEALGIPVGIINASWGGTPIESWMSREILEAEFATELQMQHYAAGKLPAKGPQFAAGALYNGMLHSLIPFTAKGFIWYQGCANRGKWEQYKRLQPAFVRMLREKWGNKRMPFYFTQIAPYQYNDPQRREAGYMMWAQAQTLEMIPHSGMAATHDVGELACIHPSRKKEVGERLAYLALENDYGIDEIDASTPMPKQFEFHDGAAFVKFDAGRLGLTPINMEIDGPFEVAGEDKVFYPAKAMIEKDRRSIKVYSHFVSNPVAVRYGMRNWSEASLFNCYGIPVTPFRSDDWR